MPLTHVLVQMHMDLKSFHEHSASKGHMQDSTVFAKTDTANPMEWGLA